MRTLPWASGRVTQRSVSVALGCSIAVGFLYRPRARLYNDSTNREQWPKTRPEINTSAGRRQEESPNAESGDHDASSANKSAGEGQEEEIPLFEDDDSAAWASFSTKFAVARNSITSIKWSSLGDKIADRVLPEWAQALPGYVAKLQREMQMDPDSLAFEIWEEAQDPAIHPNIALKAGVRISKDLCPDERAFIGKRKRYTTRALARYLDIREADIDPRDVPTIAMCSSGGGLRALVAGTSSYLSAQEAGLFDCATYTAGVSGSCWLQTLYYSSIGGRRHDNIIGHLKRRLGVHIAYPPSFLELVTRAPTNKYLLSGSIEKLKGDPKADFGLVDVYGLLLATRLLVPRDELSVDSRDLKLSNQRSYLANGANPLPIYSAVRYVFASPSSHCYGRFPISYDP